MTEEIQPDADPSQTSMEEVAVAAEGARSEADDEDSLLDDQADAAEDFLNGLLDVWDMDGETTADIEDSSILVEMHGPDMALLIGRHGSTLEALQELARATVQHQSSARARLSLDIDGYRARQRSILERRVRSIATKVRDTGESAPLDPMPAYERKLVHNALADFRGVLTTSEGEDPERRIVIHSTERPPE